MTREKEEVAMIQEPNSSGYFELEEETTGDLQVATCLSKALGFKQTREDYLEVTQRMRKMPILFLSSDIFERKNSYH